MKPKHVSGKPVIVIVSGLPRSGTSMMMKMLAAGGLPVLKDDVRHPDDDNRLGYFEFEPVKQLARGETAWLSMAHGKAVKVISALLEHLPADYHFRVVFMERNLQEVLASQRKMLANRGTDRAPIDDVVMAAAFEKHLASTKAMLAGRLNMSVKYVDHRAVVERPLDLAKQVREFLRLPLDIEAMALAVQRDLYRNRAV